ncbi:hypothetical protein B0I35DRAFT_171264 [Stachybotrys elegans]|uniref:BZIP domain-containing protein n=1 Tax=Stachybotrys elegans TaxID=80388 RepID=A0A8K0WVA9_9HYPO|nr:hypothetical protein B0I35DRAFT_171264 [Stachybotrys elegans]
MNQPRTGSQARSTAGARTGREADKPKAAKRDPERRKQQNLRAQKKYREKRQRRLEELERLVRQHEQASANSSSDEIAGSQQVSDPSSIEDDVDAPQRDEQPSAAPQQTTAAATVEPSLLDLEAPASPELGGALWTAADIEWDAEIPREYDTGSGTRAVTLFDCGCAIPHIEIVMPTSWTTRLLAVDSYPLADPYRNTIRLERECVVSALVQNCLSIGITHSMWCAKDSISPFFRPLPSASSPFPTPHMSSGDIVRSVQNIFQSLKPDLRPCTEQITISHHPYIDILPFPTLRANIILNMDLFDEEELFYDSLYGLICWGSGKFGRNIGACTGSGTPWEARNWEAKEWFIQKWMFLMGGEDGDLVRQSRWWRTLRGEESGLT